MQWRLILFLALMVLVVVFSIANAETVAFNYIFGEGDISLALVIIISALVGAVAAAVSNLSSQVKLRNALHEKDRQLRDMDRDNHELSDELEVRRVKRRHRDRPNQG